MITMPLYNVSKLTGKRISTPSAPVPIHPPTYDPPLSGGVPTGAPPSPPPSAQWSQKELEQAVRTANRLVQVALSRLQNAAPSDRDVVERLLSDLQQWTGNSLAEIGVRAPQIRNLNRSLLTTLAACRILAPQEVRELQKGLE